MSRIRILTPHATQRMKASAGNATGTSHPNTRVYKDMTAGGAMQLYYDSAPGDWVMRYRSPTQHLYEHRRPADGVDFKTLRRAWESFTRYVERQTKESQ